MEQSGFFEHFENMTQEELTVLTEKLLCVKQDKIKQELTDLKNRAKKLEEQQDIQGQELDEQKKDITEVKNFMNVLSFSVNSKKFGILRGIMAARVYALLGDKTSPECIVWGPFFFKKIHADVAAHFEVSGCGNIHIDRFEEACHVAENWRPSANYIKEKLQELRDKLAAGQLNQNRAMAFSFFLRITDDGKNMPF